LCNGSTKVFGSFSLGSNPKEASIGNIAQLVEHFVEAEGVSSSSLLISTKQKQTKWKVTRERPLSSVG
jgi:hypothetical protein